MESCQSFFRWFKSCCPKLWLQLHPESLSRVGNDKSSDKKTKKTQVEAAGAGAEVPPATVGVTAEPPATVAVGVTTGGKGAGSRGDAGVAADEENPAKRARVSWSEVLPSNDAAEDAMLTMQHIISHAQAKLPAVLAN